MCRISLVVCALALCLGEATLARAQPGPAYGYPPPQVEPPPPSGIGAIAVGYGGIGISGLNLVTIPLCYTDFYEDVQRGCVIASLAVAGVALSVGIPSLVVGLKRRARYKAWRSRQLTPLAAGTAAAAGFTYTLRF